MYKFDVFGQLMSVIRKDEQWHLFRESETGVRAKVYDVIIPDDLTPSELAGYLDDIYHEYSTETRPRVQLVN